ncbi:hypothetical protein ASE86_12935 [Sphingomonas sp. Leaf33]|uniref:GTA baseplate fiber-binding domain-containing protein n=1 Tax=Sphingomonas sp. Leaf33 TaxID=1736215 RepID=UPI0006F56E0E|nr:phage tail protein [Sphingomonas sp. Leaf33]KQN19388.1 hypothetical protein ASE86_12935 [Sphingomonas sp. Leaf33]
MATVILTAVGTAFGGPVGGAVGAMIGQAVDARVLRGKGRDGPRLTDLAVQGSSYGAPIPRLFGTMRVAGTVIWSTELIEHATLEGGGKRQTGTTRYSYSASFAVALSARPILSIGRIWADGKLLRGSGGDFKTATRFRLHTGGEWQAVDPLIAAAQGLATTPAFRGLAYAVFEDLALADFGNRIPSLTFEVTADPQAVECADILRDLSGGVIGGATGVALRGYAGQGDTVRAPAEVLLQVGGAWLRRDGDRLIACSGSGTARALADRGAGRGGTGNRRFAAADQAPRAITLQHHDPARDYQVGVQRMRRAGSGGRDRAIELPAAVEAPVAKGLAAAALARMDIERERRTLALDWRALDVVPGDRVTIVGEAGLWRVTQATLEAMVLTVELIRIVRPATALPATSGAVAAAPDTVVGATILHAFEMLPLDDSLPSTPRLMVAAAGAAPGWRSAALQLSLDGGTTWTPRGSTAAPAVLGVVGAAPGGGASTLEDRASSVEVMLAHGGMTLADAEAAALANGANLALVGDELLQFGSAERLDDRRWRLGTLWRGRRGTEWAIGTAVTGDRFVLLDSESLVAIDLPVGAIGATAVVMASGVGDASGPAEARVVVTGDSLAPPSPVHLALCADAAGVPRLRWVRRSRQGWHWPDEIGTPLAEEREAYPVRFDGRDAATAGDGGIGIEIPAGAAVAEIRQSGTHVRSRTSTIRIDREISR